MLISEQELEEHHHLKFKSQETRLRGYLTGISSRRALNDVIYDRWEFRASSSEDREPKATRFTPLQLHIFHRVGHLSIGLSGSSSALHSHLWLTQCSPGKLNWSGWQNSTYILVCFLEILSNLMPSYYHKGGFYCRFCFDSRQYQRFRIIHM